MCAHPYVCAWDVETAGIETLVFKQIFLKRQSAFFFFFFSSAILRNSIYGSDFRKASLVRLGSQLHLHQTGLPHSLSSCCDVENPYREAHGVKNHWFSRELLGRDGRAYQNERRASQSCGIADRCLCMSTPVSAAGEIRPAVVSFLSKRNPTLPIDCEPKDENCYTGLPVFWEPV